MPKIKREMNRIESLERELHLKQLQINRLLNITQAINDNVSIRGLYDMYNSFLSWEMGIKKMALYIQSEEEGWKCISSLGVDKKLEEEDISARLATFQRLQVLDKEESHPIVKEFDVVIPVIHKQLPIAYIFLGGFDEGEEMYNKVQVITTITNIIAVAIENKRLFKKQIEQERYNREMELARDMQHMLIPDTLPTNKYYELASIYKPHQSVGGDYFDSVELEDGRLIFCVADISGKGLAAALLMSNFQAHFHSFLRKNESLDNLVKDLNASLNHVTKGDKHLTMFIGIYDQKTKMLTYCNAGHNPPIIFSEKGVDTLREGCMILGLFPELPFLDLGTVKIEQETTLLTFTDGLTDMKNDQEEYFEEDLLKKFAADKTSLSAKAFNDTLQEQVESFKGKQNYTDDFTVLTCKFFA